MANAIADRETVNDALTRRARYDALRSRLWSERSTFDAHWRDLTDYLMPRRSRFWTGDRNQGDKRNQKIIDSTAGLALRTLRSGMHAGLTSPARPWFKLTTPDQDLAKQPHVKQWLHSTTQLMAIVFIESNLYNVLSTVYGDMGAFGTAAMSVLKDSKDFIRCKVYPVGSYALGLDEREMASTFIQEMQLTVRQIVERFGAREDKSIDWSTISQTVRNLWDGGHYEHGVDVVWMVTPNDQADRDRLAAKYKKFASCWYEKAGDDRGKFLRESGFDTNPILAPRWDVTSNDAYGTDCPGMTALGDIKQLQSMHRKKAQAVEKMVDPPLTGPTSLRSQKVSLHSGEITYVDTRDGQQGLRPMHEVALNLDHLRSDIGETQYRIQRAFYEDLFLMLERMDQSRGSSPVTAREIEERHEEKLLALGPVLERTDDELLDPLIDRVFDLMIAGGLVEQPPPELQGVKLKVEYISIMAQAQKLVGVVAHDRFLQTLVPLVESFPNIRHKVDINQVVDDYADMLGVDPKLVVPTDQANAAAQQEAQAQQRQADAEQTALYGKGIKDAGTTPMDGDTALNRIVGGLAPGFAGAGS